MTGAGGNVQFPFELALQAARDLWALADDFESLRGRLGVASADAQQDWLGPQQRTFDTKTSTWYASAGNGEFALRDLANELARAWAAARGEQDRINTARMAKAESDDDGMFENAWEWAAGEDDFPPPDDPPVPSAPGFHATRSPIQQSWGI